MKNKMKENYPVGTVIKWGYTGKIEVLEIHPISEPYDDLKYWCRLDLGNSGEAEDRWYTEETLDGICQANVKNSKKAEIKENDTVFVGKYLVGAIIKFGETGRIEILEGPIKTESEDFKYLCKLNIGDFSGEKWYSEEELDALCIDRLKTGVEECIPENNVVEKTHKYSIGFEVLGTSYVRLEVLDIKYIESLHDPSYKCRITVGGLEIVKWLLSEEIDVIYSSEGVEGIQPEPQLGEFWECTIFNFGGSLDAPLKKKTIICNRRETGWQSTGRFYEDKDVTIYPEPVRKLTEEERDLIDFHDYMIQPGQVYKCKYINPEGEWRGIILPFERIIGGWKSFDKMWTDDNKDCPVPICKLEEVD